MSAKMLTGTRSSAMLEARLKLQEKRILCTLKSHILVQILLDLLGPIVYWCERVVAELGDGAGASNINA